MKKEKEPTLDLINLYESYGLKAPLVRTPNDVELSKIMSAIPALGLGKKQYELIVLLTKICKELPEQTTSLKDASELFGLSLSTIRTYIKSYIDVGLINTIPCTTDPVNKRRGLLYEFKIPDLSEYLTKQVENDKKEIQRQKIKLEEIDLINHEDLTDFAFCDLITSVLFGGLRFNRKGNQTKIISDVVWGTERVTVVTLAGKGQRIALLFDLKYHIASLTVLESIIRERLINEEQITETYNIPLNSILSVLDMDKTGGNKRIAMDAIRRLSGTSFHINKLPQWFLIRYGMTEQSALHLNIFSLILEAESSEVSGSIVLQLQFPLETINQIKRSFDWTTEAPHDLTRTFYKSLSISNSLVFAFNLWTSNYFSDKGMAVMSWIDIRDRTAPQSSLAEFKKSFSKILEKYQTPATMQVISEDGATSESVDINYQPLYRNDVAINETSSVMGIRISLENEEFVLFPEMNAESLLMFNLPSL